MGSKQDLVRRGQSKLTLEGAKLMLEASERKAREMSLDMDIAICDEGGNLLAFHRMEEAKITSIEVAIGKAFTSAGTRLPTSKYAELAGPGKPAFGIHASNPGKFMIFGGGLPIQVGGEHLGGIGCSSGTVDEDTAVAQAGIEALIEALSKK